ncbi:MAG: helicase C-terminal domain-containing protein [Pseudomonadales bacterium]
MNTDPQRLAVRALVHATCQAGDLHPGSGAGKTTTEEGIRAQQSIQKNEGDEYRAEYPVSGHFRVAGVTLKLSGRVDGLQIGATEAVVDEFKATRHAPQTLAEQQGHLHWAQLQIYAALLALQLPSSTKFLLRLRYIRPDTLAEHRQERCISRDELLAFLSNCLQKFGERFAQELKRRALRNDAMANLPFPLAQFRPNQRALAGTVYSALCRSDSLLLEASTGSGKTLGILYPAARAFAETGINRYFYLTARRTGALAALRALRQLTEQGAPLVWIAIAAKGDLCRIDGERCNPQECPNALGYYDRIEDALAELLPERALDRTTVQRVASSHRVCPFELSLDAALWCDVIVGDYNYIFDPDVRLLRFANGRDSALLIDEAHQLAPRATQMLGATISQLALRDAEREVGKGQLGKRLHAVARAMTALEKCADGGVVANTEPIDRAIERLLADVAVLDWQTELSPAVAEVLWGCQHWLRRKALTRTLPHLLLLERKNKNRVLQLVCLDPAEYLRSTFNRFRSDVRFSATLRPPRLYQQLHGRADAQAMAIASPYEQQQLKVCVVTDVPTYYRHRANSLPDLTQLIHTVVGSHSGVYLVALPSFEYLSQLNSQLCAQAGLQVVAQQPDMDEQAREQFLCRLASANAATVALVVLGGVFAESVDFTNITLKGVVCVGIGLAPVSLINRTREQHFNDLGQPGELIAYSQPAMVKVVQMAGRLLRGPQDRGVLTLVDERFTQNQYQQFFPPHWHPQRLSRKELATELAKFWSPD